MFLLLIWDQYIDHLPHRFCPSFPSPGTQCTGTCSTKASGNLDLVLLGPSWQPLFLPQSWKNNKGTSAFYKCMYLATNNELLRKLWCFIIIIGITPSPNTCFMRESLHFLMTLTAVKKAGDWFKMHHCLLNVDIQTKWLPWSGGLVYLLEE